ncbi:hypothetical protein AK830_g10538 [Neonectria ditissima]|uniref:Glutamine amidotransferase domain-containing protein n=1 Tax=Neonectria ditissima TaxID=78410 RepID=A0A0P7B6Y5_9HYPO|nr:hypothetical protein AK830_g10538 [Neonectria ditissima]
MDPSFRLAVLECEAPPTPVLKMYGTYGDIVKNFLTSVVETATYPNLEILKWNLLSAKSFPDLDTIDGVLLTGSQFTAFEDDAWVPGLTEFIQRAYAARKPLVGICYGHQMISRALGGTVARCPEGWELGVQRIKLSPMGTTLFGKSSLRIHQVHQDAVIQTPPGVEAIGYSAQCGIQIAYQRGRVLSFQGHPEFDVFITTHEISERYSKESFDKTMYSDALSRVGRPHDGLLIAVAVWGHLLNADQHAAMDNAEEVYETDALLRIEMAPAVCSLGDKCALPGVLSRSI